MKLKRGLGWLALISCLLACNGLSLLGLATETPHPLPTIAPITATPPATPTLAASPALSRLAWVSGSSLNIASFAADGLGSTNHLSFAENGLPSASELAWSPTGQALAVSTASDSPQVYAVEAGNALPSESLLGPGARPAWSADGQSLVVEREGNLWLMDLAAHSSHPITNQTDWQWGNAVFAPDGKGLLVAGAPADSLGMQGNTEFYLYKIPLDGSGTLSALPGLSNGNPFFGRLPYDLQLSPNRQALAFSTSAHENACAAPTTFYVGGADGRNWREVASPTINAALDSDKEIYQEGQGLTWMPDSTALVLDSFALDCSGAHPTPIAGPLVSIVGLDGTERASLPLDLANLTVDASGRLLAGLAYPADGSPALVKVYSLSNGKPIAELGEGTAVEFGP